MAVFVLDKKKKPLMPCSEKRARLLLERKKAVVHRMAPFTIRLKDRIGGETQPVRIKLDPGSKTTGLAVVREDETDGETTAHVLFQAEIHHRRTAIKKKLDQRRAFRSRPPPEDGRSGTGLGLCSPRPMPSMQRVSGISTGSRA